MNKYLIIGIIVIIIAAVAYFVLFSDNEYPIIPIEEEDLSGEFGMSLTIEKSDGTTQDINAEPSVIFSFLYGTEPFEKLYGNLRVKINENSAVSTVTFDDFDGFIFYQNMYKLPGNIDVYPYSWHKKYGTFVPDITVQADGEWHKIATVELPTWDITTSGNYFVRFEMEGPVHIVGLDDYIILPDNGLLAYFYFSK